MMNKRRRIEGGTPRGEGWKKVDKKDEGDDISGDVLDKVLKADEGRIKKADEKDVVGTIIGDGSERKNGGEVETMMEVDDHDVIERPSNINVSRQGNYNSARKNDPSKNINNVMNSSSRENSRSDGRTVGENSSSKGNVANDNNKEPTDNLNTANVNSTNVNSPFAPTDALLASIQSILGVAETSGYIDKTAQAQQEAQQEEQSMQEPSMPWPIDAWDQPNELNSIFGNEVQGSNNTNLTGNNTNLTGTNLNTDVDLAGSLSPELDDLINDIISGEDTSGDNAGGVNPSGNLDNTLSNPEIVNTTKVIVRNSKDTIGSKRMSLKNTTLNNPNNNINNVCHQMNNINSNFQNGTQRDSAMHKHGSSSINSRMDGLHAKKTSYPKKERKQNDPSKNINAVATSSANVRGSPQIQNQGESPRIQNIGQGSPKIIKTNSTPNNNRNSGNSVILGQTGSDQASFLLQQNSAVSEQNGVGGINRISVQSGTSGVSGLADLESSALGFLDLELDKKEDKADVVLSDLGELIKSLHTANEASKATGGGVSGGPGIDSEALAAPVSPSDNGDIDGLLDSLMGVVSDQELADLGIGDAVSPSMASQRNDNANSQNMPEFNLSNDNNLSSNKNNDMNGITLDNAELERILKEADIDSILQAGNIMGSVTGGNNIMNSKNTMDANQGNNMQNNMGNNMQNNMGNNMKNQNTGMQNNNDEDVNMDGIGTGEHLSYEEIDRLSPLQIAQLSPDVKGTYLIRKGDEVRRGSGKDQREFQRGTSIMEVGKGIIRSSPQMVPKGRKGRKGVSNNNNFGGMVQNFGNQNNSNLGMKGNAVGGLQGVQIGGTANFSPKMVVSDDQVAEMLARLGPLTGGDVVAGNQNQGNQKGILAPPGGHQGGGKQGRGGVLAAPTRRVQGLTPNTGVTPRSGVTPNTGMTPRGKNEISQNEKSTGGSGPRKQTINIPQNNMNNIGGNAESGQVTNAQTINDEDIEKINAAAAAAQAAAAAAAAQSSTASKMTATQDNRTSQFPTINASNLYTQDRPPDTQNVTPRGRNLTPRGLNTRKNLGVPDANMTPRGRNSGGNSQENSMQAPKANNDRSRSRSRSKSAEKKAARNNLSPGEIEDYDSILNLIDDIQAHRGDTDPLAYRDMKVKTLEYRVKQLEREMRTKYIPIPRWDEVEISMQYEGFDKTSNAQEWRKYLKEMSTKSKVEAGVQSSSSEGESPENSKQKIYEKRKGINAYDSAGPGGVPVVDGSAEEGSNVENLVKDSPRTKKRKIYASESPAYACGLSLLYSILTDCDEEGSIVCEVPKHASRGELLEAFRKIEIEDCINVLFIKRREEVTEDELENILVPWAELKKRDRDAISILEELVKAYDEDGIGIDLVEMKSQLETGLKQEQAKKEEVKKRQEEAEMRRQKREEQAAKDRIKAEKTEKERQKIEFEKQKKRAEALGKAKREQREKEKKEGGVRRRDSQSSQESYKRNVNQQKLPGASGGTTGGIWSSKTPGASGSSGSATNASGASRVANAGGQLKNIEDRKAAVKRVIYAKTSHSNSMDPTAWARSLLDPFAERTRKEIDKASKDLKVMCHPDKFRTLANPWPARADEAFKLVDEAKSALFEQMTKMGLHK